jgi:hypothetical protein
MVVVAMVAAKVKHATIRRRKGVRLSLRPSCHAMPSEQSQFRGNQ